MRDIKFRAWGKVSTGKWQKLPNGKVGGIEWRENPEMVYFDFLSNDESYIMGDNDNVFYVNKDTPVMQYTGLKDKNGVEIYEGDVFILDDKPCLVVWSESLASFSMQYVGHIVDKALLPKELEVIGNIYENEGLLDG